MLEFLRVALVTTCSTILSLAVFPLLHPLLGVRAIRTVQLYVSPVSSRGAANIQNLVLRERGLEGI